MSKMRPVLQIPNALSKFVRQAPLQPWARKERKSIYSAEMVLEAASEPVF